MPSILVFIFYYRVAGKILLLYNGINLYYSIIFKENLMNITDYGPLKETKSHFDSDFLYNTYPCSIPLDFTEVPLHWHNEMELIYIKKGCMIVSVDLEYSVVNAGDIVVVMPGHIHSIIQNESDSCEYENILFNLDMLVSRQCDYDTVSFFNGISGFKGYCPPVISKTVPHYSDLIH